MDLLGVILMCVGLIVLLFFAAVYLCFYLAFYVPRRGKTEEEFTLPKGKAYEPHYQKMLALIRETKNMPHKEFCITSFDGIPLHAKFYEYEKGAPIELMIHGYRSSAERDLCGGVKRCFKLGRSAFVVDQRTSGKSGGNIISFGINESRDCEKWIDFIIRHFGSDSKIIITGISMGAATALITAGKDLPENVIGALADCGYTSAKDIIKKVIRDMKLPANLLYPLVKLGAKIFGGFSLEETSPEEAMKKCKIPVIFIHGEADNFVPCEMSKINYDVCTAPKKLVTFEGAAHGLSYLTDENKYLTEVKTFEGEMNL